MKRLWNSHIFTSHFSQRLVKLLFLSITYFGFFKPKQKIKVLNYNNVSIILTPLSGSSSIIRLRSEYVSSFVKYEKIYILSRPYPERVVSFYRKKIRNAHSLGKLHILAVFNMSEGWSLEQLVLHILRSNKDHKLDKHLWTENEILNSLGIERDKAEAIKISNPQLLGLIDVNKISVVNSSASLNVNASNHELSDTDESALRKFVDEN